MQMLLPVVKRGWCAIVYGGVAKVKLRLIIRRFPGAVCFDRGPRSDVSHLSLIALCAGTRWSYFVQPNGDEPMHRSGRLLQRTLQNSQSVRLFSISIFGSCFHKRIKAAWKQGKTTGVSSMIWIFRTQVRRSLACENAKRAGRCR